MENYFSIDFSEPNLRLIIWHLSLRSRPAHGTGIMKLI